MPSGPSMRPALADRASTPPSSSSPFRSPHTTHTHTSIFSFVGFCLCHFSSPYCVVRRLWLLWPLSWGPRPFTHPPRLSAICSHSSRKKENLLHTVRSSAHLRLAKDCMLHSQQSLGRFCLGLRPQADSTPSCIVIVLPNIASFSSTTCLIGLARHILFRLSDDRKRPHLMDQPTSLEEKNVWSMGQDYDSRMLPYILASLHPFRSLYVGPLPIILFTCLIIPLLPLTCRCATSGSGVSL